MGRRPDQDPSDGQCRKSQTMPTDHVRPAGERTLTMWRHSDVIGFLAE